MSGEPRTQNFDLRSWQGLTEVLKVARESTMPKDAYGEFRDLVLQYAQQGGDQELRKRIDAIIATLKPRVEVSPTVSVSNRTSEEVKEQPAGAQDMRFGSRRLVPTFAPKQTSVETVPPQPAATTPDVSTPTPTASSPLPPLEVTPVAPLLHEEVRETATPTILPTEPIAVTADTSPKNETPEEATFNAAEEQLTIKSSAEYRDRIAEIKRTVIALVGNPITLVSAENHIGRTYMTALLTAMKATAPGANMNVAEAMRNLEEAFASVEAHVATQHGVGHVEAAHSIEIDVPRQEEPAATPEDSSEVASVVAPREEGMVIDSPLPPAREEYVLDTTPEPIVASPEPADLVPDEPTTSPTPVVPSIVAEELAPVILDEMPPEALPHMEGVTPTEPQVTTEEVLPFEEPTVVPTSIQAEDVEVETAPTEPQVVAAESEDDDRSYIKAAVKEAKEASIKRLDVDTGVPFVNDFGSGIQRVPRGNVFTAVSSDEALKLDTDGPMPIPQELMSDEITKAMNGLLHDWNLFASSGLFGIGPGGMDHPLFKKLSNLKMGDIIAGSFEGSTIQLTHTIKDYVDAWRHEQGISYNPRESFEHYLRRVIQRILKRQTSEKIV